MEAFDRLGHAIERRWRDAAYAEPAFPAIAAEALREAALHERLDPWSAVRWALETPALPAQEDIEGRFGAPPLTVFRGRRFFASVLYWLDGTTSVHQHSFSGAFQVFHGSSIHGEYDFERRVEVNSHLLAGDLTLRRMEFLRQGEVREIRPGAGFVHSLFHLERPSVSIVVRTYEDVTAHPQYDYRKPAVAINPFFHEPSLVRALQSAELLLRADPTTAAALLDDYVKGADFQSTFLLLDRVATHARADEIDRAFNLGRQAGLLDTLLATARARHGELADLLPGVFEEQRRQHAIVRGRAQATSAEHRFFLALLLNAPGRAAAIELVRARFPEVDPVEAIVAWSAELSATRALGSHASSVIGVEPLDDDELFVLRGLVEGRTDEEIERAAREAFPPDVAEPLAGDVPEIAASLRASLLRPLVED